MAVSVIMYQYLCISTPFFFIAKCYFIVGILHILFIHSSIGGHLGCFQVLAIWIMLLWKFMHTFFCECSAFLLGKIARIEHLGVKFLGCIPLSLTFWRTAKLFFKATVPLYILTGNNEGYNFSTSLATLVIICLVLSIFYCALAGVAQWIEHWPVNHRVTSSIPS